MKYTLFVIAPISILAILLFSNVNPVDALGLTDPLGGKIVAKKALKVKILEDSSFSCIAVGKTIRVKLAGQTTEKDYLIPAFVLSKTGYALRKGQNILGLSSKVIPIPIVCVNDETGATKTVMLDSITMYGTSE